jgi:L-histidine N-alpha-methyltransferase
MLAYLDDGYLPLKFAYTGSAAFTHAELARTDGYAAVVGTTPLEVETLFSSLTCGVPTQIAEVGPGTGDHSAQFLAGLRQAAARSRDLRRDRSSQGPHRYLGLDFSATLLSMAAARVSDAFHAPSPSAAFAFPPSSSRLGPGPEVSTVLWDLESGRTGGIEAWRRGDERILVCILGHTLGNLEDPAQALRNLAFSTRTGDLLLLGVTLCPQSYDESDPGVVLYPYENEVFTAAVLEPLRAAALADGAADFAVRLVGRTVIGEATLTRPVELAGRRYPRSTTIRCFASARFLVPEVLDLLRGAGWRTVNWGTDESGDHLAAVAIR